MFKNNKVRGIILLLIVILLLNVNKLSIKGGNIDWNTGYPKRGKRVREQDYTKGNKIWNDKVFWGVFVLFMCYITIIFITWFTERAQTSRGFVEKLEKDPEAERFREDLNSLPRLNPVSNPLSTKEKEFLRNNDLSLLLNSTREEEGLSPYFHFPKSPKDD